MAIDLFRRLLAADVVLSLAPAGRLAYDAPADVLCDDLMALMRSHRDELVELLEVIEERAAIIEFDGGLARTDAEQAAIEEILGSVRSGYE